MKSQYLSIKFVLHVPLDQLPIVTILVQATTWKLNTNLDGCNL